MADSVRAVARAAIGAHQRAVAVGAGVMIALLILAAVGYGVAMWAALTGRLVRW